ncbi:MAG: hypothetical protein KF777_16840 [Planctomycetaceae bacterium]|nr:hypothetical protein [Planctomycetaceae bacterium]
MMSSPWMLLAAAVAADPSFDNWTREYADEALRQPHVVACWQFSADNPLEDRSGHGHELQLFGAEAVADGKFGGGLRSFPGYPVEDKRHAAFVKAHPSLSPAGAFTIDMWIKPAADMPATGYCYLLCKKYVSHNDYQFYLAPAGAKRRALVLNLGFGTDSEAFQSEPAEWPADVWQHVAVTYDAAGTVRFYRNGEAFGGRTSPARRAISPGPLGLSIADRTGSNYGGFPGVLDQVRLTNGVREFGRAKLEVATRRTSYLRFEEAGPIVAKIHNLSDQPLTKARLTVMGAGPALSTELPEIVAASVQAIPIVFDTTLRPDRYDIVLRLEVPGEIPTTREARQPIHVVSRPLPHRMPVTMWGIGGPEGFAEELPRLLDLGFTHSLGFRPEEYAIWKAGKPIDPISGPRAEGVRRMLDLALAHQFGIAANFAPGHALVNEKSLQRVDRTGKPYERVDLNASLPGLYEYCENVGISVARAFGDHPALQAALIDSEVRDSSQPSFSEFDRDAYRKFAGTDIPEDVVIKNGVQWTGIKDFPADRVIPDDHPILKYYRWFWTVGDGWNGLHTAVHKGLKSTGRDDIWTWYDPAIRVASIGGSGGLVDVLGQWTYTEPSPLRVGYFADEVFAMSAASPQKPKVMKMTQLFWYRSSSAPIKTGPDAIGNPFDDHDPDAAYISISPMHLRQSFWTKLSRPVAGLMYHGWSSLVETDGTHAYKFTQPDTQTEFRRLHTEVLPRLGPTLLQVQDDPTDVAYLDSFTSQMFARRGSYGYSHDEAFLTLLHAQLQPRVIFEETLLKDGLDAYKVLVLVDCDVLTRSVADAILAFQKRGGIIIGDPNLVPAIKPDIVIPRFTRTRKAADDKATLLANAAKLRVALDQRYSRVVETGNAEIIPRRRVFETSDYVFLVNDHREAGTYVGQHGLVQEVGLPSVGTVHLRRDAGHVYDLRRARSIPATSDGGILKWPVNLEPGGGEIYLVASRPIEQVQIDAADVVRRGGMLPVTVRVTSQDGEVVDAVIPVEVEIQDAHGRMAEFSGFYGAAGGELKLNLQIAANDVPGAWTISVREGATGRESRHDFRVTSPAN